MDRTNGIHHDGVMKSKHRFIGSQPIVSDRIRNIDGGFSFIPHRFLRDGFWQTLTAQELHILRADALAPASAIGMIFRQEVKIHTRGPDRGNSTPKRQGHGSR